MNQKEGIWYNYANYEIKSKILNGVVKYGAAVLFAQRQTNEIESELEIMLRDYNKNHDFDKLLLEINKRKNGYVDEFRTTLYNSSIGSRKKKAISLLKFIEIYGNQNHNALYATKTDKDSITLEHILPQTISDGRLKDFENVNEYNRYVNYLGNLTILKQADNSSIKNNIFKEKKETYLNSEYIMTRTIIKPVKNTKVGGKDYEYISYLNEWNSQYNFSKKNWTKKTIDERGQQLTNYIIELLE